MNKRKGAAMFVASACVSLVVLGCCLLVFLLYMKASTQAEAIKHDVPYEEPIHPDPEESLAVVFLGCEEAESLPGLIQLAVYNAPEASLTIVGIPSRILCTVEGRTDTLAGQYEYEGIRGALNGIRSLLSYDVDRYLRTQSPGLANLVDFFGGVELNPERELSIGDHTLSPGRQLLDGRQVTGLLFAQDFHGNLDAEFQTQLTGELFTQRLPTKLGEQYDAFADAIFYNCESNLSRYDLVMRKRGLSALCKSGQLTLYSLTLEGEEKADGSGLLPKEDSLEAICRSLQPAEESQLSGG